MPLFKGKRIDLEELKKVAGEGVKAASEGLSAAADSVKNAVKDIDLAESAKQVQDAASSGLESFVDSIKNLSNADHGEEGQLDHRAAFFKLLFYMAEADGVTSSEELDKIDKIAFELDPDYSSYGTDLRQTCLDQIEVDAKEFGHLNAVKMGAQNVMAGLVLSENEKKLLCWDLYAVGGTDGITDGERAFIKFVCDKIGLDEVLFSELDNYFSSLVELEHEEALMRQSDRPYKEIEPFVNELSDRRLAIVDAAQQLIMDE